MTGLMDAIAVKSAPSCEVQIFIGGDASACKNLLASAAVHGACYSCEPTEFVYTGGRETGLVVRLINYPRFPRSAEVIENDALVLAELLLVGLHQGSCTVQTPTKTLWLSRRVDQ